MQWHFHKVKFHRSCDKALTKSWILFSLDKTKRFAAIRKCSNWLVEFVGLTWYHLPFGNHCFTPSLIVPVLPSVQKVLGSFPLAPLLSICSVGVKCSKHLLPYNVSKNIQLSLSHSKSNCSFCFLTNLSHVQSIEF